MARPELFKHRKLRRLCGLIRLPVPYAVGLLETLWNTVYETGDPYVGTPWEVKIACMYEGDEHDLTNALAESGFLDEVAEGEYQVHDLHENAPRYVRDRWRKREKRRGQGADNSATRPQNVHLSPPLPTLHKQSKRSTRAGARTYSPEFQAFWEKYPKSRRKEKPKAYDAWVKLSTGDRQQAIARLADWIAAHHDDSQPQYTVYPERYLKRRRWEDEVDAPKRRWGEKDRQ